MRLVNSLTALGLLACLVAAPAVAQAQTVTKQSQATATVTIQAINSTTPDRAAPTASTATIS